ncbi:MAG: sigma-70 family RNA polymerase sigma factor [Pseudomonadota bacterium]
MVETRCNNALDALLANTAMGDRQAFRTLYTATSGKLFAVIIKILGNTADASEVLQEAYITVWRRAGRFDPERGKAISWLAVIARNAAIDAIRKRRPEQVGEEFCEHLVDEQPTPFDCLLENDVSKELLGRMHRLPVSQRNAVRLFYLEENSLAEISYKMEAPINTVKSWVRRGVANLRSEFSDQKMHEFL